MKTRQVIFSILAAVIAAGSALAAAAAPPRPARHFQLQNLRRLVRLSSPQISPNGKFVAVIVSRPDWNQDTRRQSIDLVAVATGKTRPLTYHRRKLSEPRWSPDGTRLAFIAKDPQSGKPQVFIMPMNGGDSRRITNTKTGVVEYAWSPDGRRIAFISEDTPKNEKALKRHDDAFRVTDNNYMTRHAVPPWHLWIVAAAGGKSRRLTRGTWSLDTNQDTVTPLAWSPDGKRIAFTRFPDPYYGNSYRSVIAAVDLATDVVRPLVTQAGAMAPAWAADGDSLAYQRPRNGDLNNGTAVYVVASGQRAPFDVTSRLARNISAYAWFPGGSALLLSGLAGTRGVFWRQPLTGTAGRLDLGRVNATNQFSVSRNGRIAFIGTTAYHPDELYILPSARARPRRLTDLNGFVDSLRLGRVSTVNWTVPGGFHEDGVLTYPVNFHAGRRYPLVLVIHGGPESASIERFDPLVQLLAARGFLVFQPNYRGSTNLGDAYQHAIYRDTGAGPGRDIMAGLKRVESRGIVERSRIGVSGWSYGGYMTSWLNGNYPGAWKAAVEGAALNDWVMDYTIAFYQHGDLYFFGGSPWVQKYRKIWRTQSPIAYAANVKAPTLIMGDQGDPNVPIVNSYEMFHALQDNGVTTEFYVYPVDTHFPHDIVRRTDVYRRWIEWLTKYLKPRVGPTSRHHSIPD